MTQFSLKPPPQYDGANRQAYDTIEGVRGYLGSIADFRKLCALRQQAANQRQETLNTLYIFGGRFMLDQFGQLWKSYNPSTDKVPDVLSIKEYNDYLKSEQWYKDLIERMGHGPSFEETAIPNQYVVCPYCKSGWTVNNMHDFYFNDVQIDDIPLVAFVGKTVRDVFTAFSVFTDAMYVKKYVEFLYNDKYIDMSPVPFKNSQGTYPKNEAGVLKPEGDIYDYVIADGDRGHFTKREFFHVKCMRKQVTSDCWKKVSKSLYDAGFKDYKVEQIDNEYSGYPFYPNWFVIKTDLITMKIGERKKVINVEIIGENNLNLEELFAAENVTKSENNIHAWGYEKLTEYLKTIRETLVQQPVI